MDDKPSFWGATPVDVGSEPTQVLLKRIRELKAERDEAVVFLRALLTHERPHPQHPGWAFLDRIGSKP